MWTKPQLATKRCLDLVISLGALVGLGWLLLIAWIAAAVETRTSGLFIQERVGKGESRFGLIKLRTMRMSDAMTGTVTVRDDPRVTRIGRILRAWKIDELPQILNVLAGTMSIVGPRPTVTSDVERMSAEQRRRHEMKPGLTGLAQVNGSTGLPWPRRIEYDLEYVDRGNLRKDLGIIFLTARLLLSRKIETHPPGEDEWVQVEKTRNG